MTVGREQQWKKAELTRCADRARVADLLLSGIQSTREIARRMGKHHDLIRRRLREIEEEWRQQYVTEYELARGKATAIAYKLFFEAFQGWERSKLPRESSRTAKRTRGGAANGAGQEAADEALLAEIKTEKRDGDPRFLQLCESILDKIVRLGSGYVQPIKQEGGAETHLTVVQILQQIAAAPPATPEVVDERPGPLAALLRPPGGNGNGDGNGEKQGGR